MLIKDKDILADEPVRSKPQPRKPRIKKENMSSAWGDVFDYYIRNITERYLRFRGRASRLEFWGFWLVSELMFLILYGLGKYVDMPMLSYYYTLAVVIPTFAVTARRLHDINKNALVYIGILLICVLSSLVIKFYALILIAIWIFILIRLLSMETDISDGFYGEAEETDEVYGEDNLPIIRKFRFLALALLCIICGTSYLSFDEWQTQAEYTGTKDLIMEQIETAGKNAQMTPEQIEAAQQIMSQTLKVWSGQTVNPDDIQKAMQDALQAVSSSK